ncbi:5-oxoprolinase subunit PxpB [Mariniflexile ostreae]|uniref:5-oxoprolinase subunit PxpB n=1 Tax=Mariniflexile ostreae TaxID=1520892 RepID=A0ABV5FAS4_9FLAO
MKRFKPTYKAFGERSILIEWPQEIDVHILKDIINFKEEIQKFNIKPLVELISAYNSLLLIYNEFYKGFDVEIEVIEEIYSSKRPVYTSSRVLWKIPVCYHVDFGVDLAMISKDKNMTVPEVVQWHSSAIYTVYFIGFLPGFLYLGGLNEKLYSPRKATPRLKVEKGAVAIGGGQTGVYPNESPGGWNIIGNTPVSFFDVSNADPCFAKPGDALVFYPISVKEHQEIKALVDGNMYKLKHEIIYD